MPRWAIFCAVGLAFVTACSEPAKREVSTPPEPERPVELRAVNVNELDAELAKHRGKVVLIDVWFLGCAPCVKRFPKFVELHRELRGDGLVCISLNVYPEELKKKDKVLEFLKDQKANTINLIVDDTEKALGAWQDKYDAGPTPSYVILNRKGEWVKTPQPEDKENVTRTLKKLLAENSP